ncbi:MAG: hypothetical protein WBE17_05835 [Anaerolineae bacterium]
MQQARAGIQTDVGQRRALIRQPASQARLAAAQVEHDGRRRQKGQAGQKSSLIDAACAGKSARACGVELAIERQQTLRGVHLHAGIVA